MRWIRSLAAGTAAAALFSAPAFASNRTSATNAISEKKLIQDSGYSGWQRKWANVNQIGDRNVQRIEFLFDAASNRHGQASGRAGHTHVEVDQGSGGYRLRK